MANYLLGSMPSSVRAFSFVVPTKIDFGLNRANHLAELTQHWGRTFLIVHGRRFLRNSCLWDDIVAPLQSMGKRVVSLQGIPPDPGLQWVDDGRRMVSREEIDVVVGIGGGSVLDVAKAVAGLASSESSTLAHYEGTPVPGHGLPCVAIPTTSGTGAEVTPNAVLTALNRSEKKSIRGDALRPKLAIVDPGTTVSLGQTETAQSGLDALCQAIESHTSIHANPFTQSLSLLATKLAWENILPACNGGTLMEPRVAMALASTLAGVALANARLGAVHGLAHPIGALYQIPHGLACGLLLPHVTATNLETAGSAYGEVAEACGLSNVDGLPEALILRLKDLSQPTRLRDLGVKKEDFPEIARRSMPSGSLKANPRPMTESLLCHILEEAW